MDSQPVWVWILIPPLARGLILGKLHKSLCFSFPICQMKTIVKTYFLGVLWELRWCRLRYVEHCPSHTTPEMLARIISPWSPSTHLRSGMSQSRGHSQMEYSFECLGCQWRHWPVWGLTSTSKKCPAGAWVKVSSSPSTFLNLRFRSPWPLAPCQLFTVNIFYIGCCIHLEKEYWFASWFPEKSVRLWIVQRWVDTYVYKLKVNLLSFKNILVPEI